MGHHNKRVTTRPQNLLQRLAKNLKSAVWNLECLSECISKTHVGETIEQLERIDDNLATLIKSPSFISAFELVESPFVKVGPWAYVKEQKSMIGNLKKALESRGSYQTDKIRELLQVVDAVSKQLLPLGRRKNPIYAILDQIIIFEGHEYRNRTGKRPAIFLDQKTGEPGPFLRQVRYAVAVRNLSFTYEQIHDRIKPLKAHPVHGALFR